MKDRELSLTFNGPLEQQMVAWREEKQAQEAKKAARLGTKALLPLAAALTVNALIGSNEALSIAEYLLGSFTLTAYGLAIDRFQESRVCNELQRTFKKAYAVGQSPSDFRMERFNHLFPMPKTLFSLPQRPGKRPVLSPAQHHRSHG